MYLARAFRSPGAGIIHHTCTLSILIANPIEKLK